MQYQSPREKMFLLLFLKVLLKMTAYVRNGYTFLIILDKQIGLGSYKMN